MTNMVFDLHVWNMEHVSEYDRPIVERNNRVWPEVVRQLERSDNLQRATMAAVGLGAEYDVRCALQRMSLSERASLVQAATGEQVPPACCGIPPRGHMGWSSSGPLPGGENFVALVRWLVKLRWRPETGVGGAAGLLANARARASEGEVVE